MQVLGDTHAHSYVFNSGKMVYVFMIIFTKM